MIKSASQALRALVLSSALAVTGMGGFPLSRNFYVRVHVRKFYSRKSNSGEMKSVELKREVERGSTLTFTCNLS